MTRSDDLASRILLVADRRDAVAVRDPLAPKVRRYRLARIQLNERPAGTRAARNARIKRVHD
jgi:hypothetical protein